MSKTHVDFEDITKSENVDKALSLSGQMNENTKKARIHYIEYVIGEKANHINISGTKRDIDEKFRIAYMVAHSRKRTKNNKKTSYDTVKLVLY